VIKMFDVLVEMGLSKL